MKNTLGRCFYNALKNGDTKTALYVVSFADDVDGVYRGKSFLTLAKEYKNKFVERALIKKGAVKEVSISKEKALSLSRKIALAAARGDIFEFNKLYVEGADLGFVYSDKGKPTMLIRHARCSEEENIDICNLLIEGGVDVNAKDTAGYTALHKALIWGNSKLAKTLIKAGANVNAQTKEGYTPLLFAVERENAEMVKLLLDAGANINVPLIDGKTLVEYTDNNKIKKMIVEKIKERAKKSDENDKAYKLIARNTASKQQTLNLQLIEASKRGDLEKVNQLIKKGANVSANTSGYDEAGTTPLFEAACNGHLDVVKKLIEAGANVNDCVVNYVDSLYDYYNPLLIAAQKGHLEIVKTLVNSGASIYAGLMDHSTSLSLAVEYKRTDIVKYLIEKGADVNEKDVFGCTVLMKALSTGNLEIMEMLVDKGADVYARDERYKDVDSYCNDPIIFEAYCDMRKAKAEEKEKKKVVTKDFPHGNDGR